MSSAQRAAKSPILAAIGISLAIAAGSIIATLEPGTIEDVATGKALTRPLAEAQQRNTLAIVSLENTVGAISRDIDFVSSRVSTMLRRSEEGTSDRLAHLDAEIAALKDKIAGIQHARIAPVRAPEPARETSDVSGLRSSLNDLSLAHSGAVAAITRRLDRIEIKVGLTTDTPPVADASAQRNARVKASKRESAPPVEAHVSPAPAIARPERGHIFNVKPISHQGAPLRISKLPG